MSVSASASHSKPPPPPPPPPSSHSNAAPVVPPVDPVVTAMGTAASHAVTTDSTVTAPSSTVAAHAAVMTTPARTTMVPTPESTSADAVVPPPDTTAAKTTTTRYTIPPEAAWPDALPRPGEQRVVTIVCGNTSTTWAMYTISDAMQQHLHQQRQNCRVTNGDGTVRRPPPSLDADAAAALWEQCQPRGYLYWRTSEESSMQALRNDDDDDEEELDDDFGHKPILGTEYEDGAHLSPSETDQLRDLYSRHREPSLALAKHFPGRIQAYFFGQVLYSTTSTAAADVDVAGRSEDSAQRLLQAALQTTRMHLPDRDPGGNEELVLPAPASQINGHTHASTTSSLLPDVTVYFVVSNEPSYHRLASLFRHVPCCRLFRLQASDFFPRPPRAISGATVPTTGVPYATYGTDRAASLYYTIQTHGNPALVFDAGTALTFSASDSTGAAVGGGITLGLQAKFNALANGTKALPRYSYADVDARLMEIANSGHPPLPCLHVINTKDAILSGVVRETALYMRSVLVAWVEELKQTGQLPLDPGTGAILPLEVVITGGDGKMLTQLMENEMAVALDIFNAGTTTQPTTAPRNEATMMEIPWKLRKSLFLEKKNGPSVRLHFVKHCIHLGVVGMITDKLLEPMERHQPRRVRFDRNRLVHHLVDPAAAMVEETDHRREEVARTVAAAVSAANAPATAVVAPSSQKKSKRTAHDARTTGVEDKKSPPNKKAKSTTPSVVAARAPVFDATSTEVSTDHPKAYVKRRLAKYFGDELYFGYVKKHTYPRDNLENVHLFLAHYDDGDEEDLYARDLSDCFRLYDREKHHDPKGAKLPHKR